MASSTLFRTAAALLVVCAVFPAVAADEPWLVDISVASGLRFSHESGAAGDLHMPEIMGAGAALFDYDADGDLDIYLVNGGPDPATGKPGDGPSNRLFRQGDSGKFADVTAGSGLGDSGYGMGVAVGDVDNDGDLDVYLSNFGPDRLYRNRGDGTFADASADLAGAADGWSGSATFLDYDGDGWLDLYVTQYVKYDPEKKCTDSAGRPDYCGPRMFPPVHDVLLHNEGGGKFRPVAATAGIHAAIGAGLGVVAQDLDADTRVDVYVANDGYANQLWKNKGDGKFHDTALLLGVAYNMNGEAEAGMGVVAADFDGDLDLDLFVTHLAEESNTVYRFAGKQGFDDATGASGLGSRSLPHTGFGVAPLDIELDGDLDLVVVNGRVTRGKPHPRAVPPAEWARFAEPNQVFFNDGAGRFREAADGAGFARTVEVSRGLAIGDVDNDGDLDLLVSNTHGPARLYRNDAPRRGSWLTVRAIDPRYKRDAYGATVKVSGAEKSWLRTVGPGFSYLSSSDSRAHFGLGKLKRVERIEVRWPDGLREIFPGGSVDRSVTLQRGSGKPAS
jgi:hypothetical protein